MLEGRLVEGDVTGDDDLLGTIQQDAVGLGVRLVANKHAALGGRLQLAAQLLRDVGVGDAAPHAQVSDVRLGASEELEGCLVKARDW